jgi:glycosyltransferase involved in cell wall biosynthesis
VSRRVLHVAQPTDAGVARCATDFAADQLARGWDVVVACPSDGPLPGWLAGAGVRHRAWEASRSPGASTLAETRSLARLVADVDPDLVHLHSSKAGLAGRLAIRGRRPTVFQPHAWSFDAVTGPLRAATVAWERLGARWAHAVICVSEAERAAGADVGIDAEWHVVPNGVDLRTFRPSSRTLARARLGLDDAPTVVCVGRLCRQKGQDLLLDAWPAVRVAVPGARLELVGDGPDHAALAARRLPGVSLRGRRDDVPDWYSAADVVALPSRWEGMSLAVLEALACGASLVAADVTGVRESLPPDHRGLVPPDDTDALAGAVAARLVDSGLASEEGALGADHVARRHSLESTCEGIAAVYEAVLRS